MKLVLIAAFCLLLDVLLGDPARMPHPVVFMGACIGRLETRPRARLGSTAKAGMVGQAGQWAEKETAEADKTARDERHAGRVLAAVMVLGTLIISSVAIFLAGRVHAGLRLALEILWGWQCLAMRGLLRESRNVRIALTKGTLDEARRAVGQIVGRDTASLDEKGVIRAAVESVAENFSDGVIAPLLYFLIGGAPLALCYKAINTMDSMVGYRNERYLHFGRAAARLDDAANFLPSRLSALLLILSAALRGGDAGGALRIWRRDRRMHDSPNSAQTEAAMAGGLGLRLGGPASYLGEIHDKPFIGEAVREPEPGDIDRAGRLMYTAGILGVVVLGGLRLAGLELIQLLGLG